MRLTAAGKTKTEVKKRVEMINQMLDQLAAAQLSQTAPSQDRQQGKDGVDFDGMLQQKRQEAERPAQGQDKQGVQKEDAPKAEVEKPQAAQQGQEDEVPEDAAAVLAAMMLQPQQQAEAPQVQAVQEAAPAVEAVEAPVEAMPQQQDVAVQAAPQEAAQTVQPQVQVQVQAQDTAVTPQAAEQAAPQQVTQQVQTPEQPQAEAPAEQAAPETVVQATPQEGRADGQAAETDVTAADAGQAQDGETAEEIPVEAPVFQQEMEAAPVKVAEPVLNPENPVHIEGEEAPQGIVDAMQQCMDGGKEESIGVIQIEPENLGPVTMRLTRDGDGVIHMVLEALNPKTAALLDKHAADIQNIAAENTHQEVRVEIKSEQNQPFPENWKDGQNQHGQQQEQQQRQGQQREERRPSMEDFMHRLRLGLVGSDT